MILSIGLSAISSTEIYACTVLTIKDTGGNTYQGRTNEFAGQQPDSLTYFPTGTRIESVTPDGGQGKTFNTMHGILAVTLKGMTPGAKQDTLHEAVNDSGLTFSTNAFSDNSPPAVDYNSRNILSVVDLGTWALGNFETVTEVKKAIEERAVDIWLPRIASMGNLHAPVHFALFDRKGDGIVIEFTDGKTVVYDNPVGVMTNSPAFPWHLQNLKNYTQLTNVDKNEGQFYKLRVTAPDSGNALAGVPSTQISPGRFVKAAFYANYVRKANSSEEAIQTLGHVMNNFDRPFDLSMDEAGTTGPSEASTSLKPSSEVTYFTVLNDLSENLFFIRTIDAINFARIDVRKLRSVKGVKVVPFKSINAINRLDATWLFLN